MFLQPNIFLLLVLLNGWITAIGQEAKEIVRQADEKARGKTSQSEVTIQIIRPSWTREISAKAWSKGNDYSVIMITAPARDHGTTFLKRKKEVWNWVPSVERTIKLPPSMMSQSWMGTDLTNDDLVKESSMVLDYTHKLVGDSTIDGRSCYKIEMIPLSEAAVVWGKILVWIDKNDYLQLCTQFYDEDGILINTMQAYDIKMLGGRLLPSRMEMIPEDKKGQKTVLIYRSIVFDKPIEDSFFTTANIARIQ